MKDAWKEICLAAVLGLVIPGVLLSFAAEVMSDKPLETEPTEEQLAQVQPLPEAEPMVMRLRGTDGSVTEMDMDEYLVGVVLGEMPAYFETEALKAQAVVARTYTRKAFITGGKHEDGSVCTESSCCQAYIAEADYLAMGGDSQDVEKIRAAVNATSGYVLVYKGELIEATYFSCSGGTTEDAAAVWGTDFPYLRSVSSPGEEEATHYRDTVTFTKEQLEAALGITLSGDSDSWVGMASYTAGGGVATITIAGAEFEGTQLRQLLGLKSTAFTVEAGDGILTFTTRGFGHRVGMSQFGADAMAVQGSNYADILAYYYQGTELMQWDKVEN